jgi:hypothetical protein
MKPTFLFLSLIMLNMILMPAQSSGQNSDVIYVMVPKNVRTVRTVLTPVDIQNVSDVNLKERRAPSVMVPKYASTVMGLALSQIRPLVFK